MTFRQGARRILATGLAVAMLTFFKAGCSTENVIRTNGPKEVNTTLTFQSSYDNAFTGSRFAKRVNMDSIPIPLEKQMEGSFYYPDNLTPESFRNLDADWRAALGRSWRKKENAVNPFELSDSAFKAYSPAARQDLKERWELAKEKVRVAFMSNKGATPENAFELHSPSERKKMLEDWEFLRGGDNYVPTTPIKR